MKICPFVDGSKIGTHTAASREGLAQRLKDIQEQQNQSPFRDVFEKTFIYFTALQRQGCASPPHEPTIYIGDEAAARENRNAHQVREQRGHSGKETCNGRLLFRYTASGRAFIQCEHYNRNLNIDHFIDFRPGNGLLNSTYLEALFLGDKNLIEEFEEDAAIIHGVGPRVQCSSIANYSTIKVNCSFEHRSASGILENPEMVICPCPVKFRIYEPLPDYREECPWVLVVCPGEHSHPIPIPSKTPPSIRAEIFQLLDSLESDLSDLTPRRFLRHPSVKIFLKKRLPRLLNPMLLDLHPSLGNRDHLRGYIKLVQDKKFPAGTGWEGIINLKKQQDETIPQDERYIRYIAEIPALGQLASTDDPTDDVEDSPTPFRIIICMSKNNSIRLSKAHYVQSDIGFKRIAGYQEFELGGLDPTTRISNISTYCRIYLNRQTAEAHRLIFHKIDEIVEIDTGHRLKWRHIHSKGPTSAEAVGIYHIAVDQHGGQAKGFGLYLKDIAASVPRMAELHEPQRLLQDLDEYEHLRRILRLCRVHFLRNIQQCGVSNDVRQKMRSLLCMEHPNWDTTIREIEGEGGKAAKDWVADKVRSKFAFSGICWAKSFIPREIWQIGDETSNIIESLHSDVNREGLSCTLLGGIIKGQHFDTLKEKTLENLISTGVRPSYHRGHISESVTRSLKRKSEATHKILEKQDQDIVHQNKKIKRALEGVTATHEELERFVQGSSNHLVINRAEKKREKAMASYKKAVEMSTEKIGTGSGKVGLLLPPLPDRPHSGNSTM
ncbi:hypothetical protein M413DRAFT_449233 [Hebeloma cylindrosporum]|uniref:Uncharacterized protein n=1 Tax=Hebeloma cylindrosporum TaxID=76867 RepID=A0A0C3BW86_HEBCY|nr:hypothetical protein M413DRAFT_449233 [Hebeloma cylindrosporum h7]